MPFDYTLNELAILINAPVIPDGQGIRVSFTSKHTSDSLNAIGESAVAAYTAANLYEWLAGQHITNPHAYAAYLHHAQALRQRFAELLGLSCGEWATPLLLTQRFSSEEMSQHADKTGLLNGDSLVKAIERTLTDPELLPAASAAIERLCRACKDADATVNQHIVHRVPDKETLSVGFKTALSNAASDIARYYLFDDGSMDKDSVVQLRYNQAIKYLTDFRDGKFMGGPSVTPSGPRYQTKPHPLDPKLWSGW